MLGAPFQLSSFIVASYKGVTRDSSIDRCLLFHWVSSHFPMPSPKVICLNVNAHVSSNCEG